MNENDGVSVELVHDSSTEHPKIHGSMVGLPEGFEELKGTHRLGRTIKSIAGAKAPKNLPLWVMMMMGLTLAILGVVLYPTVSEALFPVLLSGSLYILFPALVLWKDRRRYPKKLETDGETKRSEST